LIISAGPQEGREILLLGGTMTIGRDTAKVTWDIAIQDQALSRPHAQIEREEDDFILTDLDSANGTRVNGDKITEPTTMKDGDVITMGQTTFLFRAR
jgi:pSer/pThr/pTyr-binding forkhead associated (FHA) protein